MHLASGRATEAREAWQAALAILDELGHPEASQVREKLENLASAQSGAIRQGSPSDELIAIVETPP
jgi:hypothetical protein